MTIEQDAGPEQKTVAAGRIAAWIARQVEIALGEGDEELSPSQYRVLALLGDGRALPSSMADRLDVRRPSVTAVVDGLVHRGLVVRTPAEDDRRQISHGITPRGRHVLAAADEAVDRRLGEIAACLGDPAEAERAMEALALWGQALLGWRAAKQAKVEA